MEYCFVTKSVALNTDCFYKVWNSSTSKKYKSSEIKLNKCNSATTITDQKKASVWL